MVLQVSWVEDKCENVFLRGKQPDSCSTQGISFGRAAPYLHVALWLPTIQWRKWATGTEWSRSKDMMPSLCRSRKLKGGDVREGMAPCLSTNTQQFLGVPRSRTTSQWSKTGGWRSTALKWREAHGINCFFFFILILFARQAPLSESLIRHFSPSWGLEPVRGKVQSNL